MPQHNINAIIRLSYLGGMSYNIRMDRFGEIENFIQRAHTTLKEAVNRSILEEKWKNKIYYDKTKNLPKNVLSRKKYEKSPKGKIARKGQSALYNHRVKEHSRKLSWFEKHQIRKFYVKCPKNHHVDHIIPLSRGGFHCLANLQYLPSAENLRKNNNFYIDDRIKFIKNKHIRR